MCTKCMKRTEACLVVTVEMNCCMCIFFSACNHNMYGLDCKETCGKCSNKTQCNHVNGSCSEGCSAGFHGDKCNMGMKHLLFLLFIQIKKKKIVGILS